MNVYKCQMLNVCFVISRSTTSLNEEPTEKFTDEMENVDKRNERTLEDQIKTSYTQPEGGITREILQKIKEINLGLQKPKRHQINYNTQPYGGGYILDKAILEKIQQIIAAGKLNGLSGQQKVSIHEESNSLNDDIARYENARALPYVQPGLTNNVLGNQALGYMPLPYVTSLPVVVMPSVNGVYGAPATNDLNSLNANYLRQVPSLPFQVPWPLAPFFPILLKDPLLHYLQGGSWENLLEYGQSADVCNRRQKSSETGNIQPEISIDEIDDSDNSISLDPVNVVSSRQGRKIKKRTISKSAPIQKFGADKDVTKLFTQKPLGVKKPVKKEDPPIQDTKANSDNEGDLRFPFGDFNWFGNRKPVAPSPGFFINRLKVRRGGVAIAGPGGVATAGRGGTAIVGPGGLAYTQPGGLAVAGPAARIVALAPDADLNSVVTRLQQQSATDGSVPRLLQAIPEGKVVATGPIIYYHPYRAQ